MKKKFYFIAITIITLLILITILSYYEKNRLRVIHRGTYESKSIVILDSDIVYLTLNIETEDNSFVLLANKFIIDKGYFSLLNEGNRKYYLNGDVFDIIVSDVRADSFKISFNDSNTLNNIELEKFSPATTNFQHSYLTEKELEDVTNDIKKKMIAEVDR